MDISENQILAPDKALSAWRDAPLRPLVFVDDFVGSGQQFELTWHRPRDLVGESKQMSFAEIKGKTSRKAYYCPLVCTESGRLHIANVCRGVVLRAVHTLNSDRDGVFSPASDVWPPGEREASIDALRTISLRVGMPATGPGRWDGFEGLGLAFAFQHSVPDATLPIFYWEESGWKPLIRRR